MTSPRHQATAAGARYHKALASQASASMKKVANGLAALAKTARHVRRA